ncbi:MAG: hypothetical protein FWE83_06665 [Oscillospiraceae bacterium]|nr:hypothetical protein [Oscillospiraceae bacterium]
MTLNNRLSDKYGPYVFILLCAIVVYSLIYTLSVNFSPIAGNHYNTFSRQAESWLHGRLSLPENVPWLELAIFEGRYYVSFPPFPSIVMLPFVLLFGINTPDHAIALCLSFLSLFYAYRLGIRVLSNKKHAVIFSLFLILGTNYLHISLWGAVWYITQNFAFLLTLMAFYYALTDNRKHSFLSLFFMCAAMGCRPFNILYLPVVLYLIYRREAKPLTGFLKRIFVYAIPAITMGTFYLWHNYARFGSIFDFGHNYLPEFVNDPHGQFYIGRVLANLGRMFFSMDFIGFPLFYGFAFWLASPIVVSFVVYFIVYLIKGFQKCKSIDKAGVNLRHSEGKVARNEAGLLAGDITCNDSGNQSIIKDNNRVVIYMLLFLIAIHLLAFSFHRTMGGHQFGARYTVDTLPAFYLGLLLMLKKLPRNGSVYLNIPPMIFGLLLNFQGTVEYLVYYFQ